MNRRSWHRRVPQRWAALALMAGAQAACAAIGGLDSYSMSGGGGDATVGARQDATGGSDVAASDDALPGDEGGDAASGSDAESGGPGDEAAVADSGPGDGTADTSTLAADAQPESGRDASGPDASTCSMTLCSGACVDLKTDPNHCGSCSNSCSSGLCGTTIPSWTTSPSLWRTNGNASVASGQFGASTGVLTAAQSSQAGSLVYVNPVVTDSFTATFSVYLGGGGSGAADGMGFAWQTQGASALGGSGGCLGMCGLPGYGVELDTYNNQSCGDSNANHLAVDQLTGCSMAFPMHLTSTGAGLPTLDNASHTVVVQLSGGAVSVTLDGTSRLSNVSLPGFTPGTAYYYGFAGATGGSFDAHEVSPSNFAITFPSPRCL